MRRSETSSNRPSRSERAGVIMRQLICRIRCNTRSVLFTAARRRPCLHPPSFAPSRVSPASLRVPPIRPKYPPAVAPVWHIGSTDTQTAIISVDAFDPLLLAEGIEIIRTEKNLTFRQAIRFHWRAILWSMFLSLALVMDGSYGAVVSPLVSARIVTLTWPDQFVLRPPIFH